VAGTLDVKGALAVTGTLNGSGSGKILVDAAATVTGGTFYNAGETAMTDVKGTYNWVTGADGAGTAGWQEASTVVTG
jgi:hypothetical protein